MKRRMIKLEKKLEVVRGALLGELTLEKGARRLRVPKTELARLVEGARRKVIAELGEHALEAARVRC
jgi:predicted DNA-binding protein (UPF0251 family)